MRNVSCARRVESQRRLRGFRLVEHDTLSNGGESFEEGDPRAAADVENGVSRLRRARCKHVCLTTLST
jgi:hypothetical protein